MKLILTLIAVVLISTTAFANTIKFNDHQKTFIGSHEKRDQFNQFVRFHSPAPGMRPYSEQEMFTDDDLPELVVYNNVSGGLK